MQKRYSRPIIRGAALVLLGAMLAGCGGQSSTPAAPRGNATTVTAVASTPATSTAGGAEGSHFPTPTAVSAGNSSSGPGLDLTAFDVCGP